ncbi:MAG: hypothetical protein ACOC5E_01645 [Acidobacteriota bacterium]
MADLSQVIGPEQGLVGGDDFDVVRTVIDLPEGRSVDRAWLTVLEDLDDPDSEAVFQKEITDGDDPDQGVIEDAGSGSGDDRKARVRFRLQKDETREIRGRPKHHFDVQLQLDNGKITTPFAGEIWAAKDATKAEE